MKLSNEKFVIKVMSRDRLHIPAEIKIKYDMVENTHVVVEDNGNGFTVTPGKVIKREPNVTN